MREWIEIKLETISLSDIFKEKKPSQKNLCAQIHGVRHYLRIYFILGFSIFYSRAFVSDLRDFPYQKKLIEDHSTYFAFYQMPLRAVEKSVYSPRT